ncbi:calmodulin [Chrysochromulina tobinii]|uniref:Calmodulin n=1 Tax=Chrysochromulina tobinii TaxID=1460289 RepID=A0A0M0J641_9EUKA|nr:calmodulin [Chrysochromulina tobinii]|eukprot:KOO22056.1 calmodulin [Chrysochromulina sp. CCMP291]
MRNAVPGKEITVLEQRQAALKAKLAETEAALQQQRQRRHSDESRKREDDLLASVFQTAESVRHTARGADLALSRLLDGELMPDAEAAALLGDLLAHTSASADALRYKYSAPRGSSTRTEGSLLASENGAMRPRSAASGPVDPASADSPVREAAAASQRLGASSARTAAVGGVRLSEHATLTEVPRPRKAPVLPRPRAKPAWDDRQTAITPTPWEMLPTEAEVARAHRHELQRQQQVRQQQQDAKESQHACAHHGALLSPQAARQLGAQNDASGPSGDPRGVSSNGCGSGSAVLSAALSSSSLGVGDAQDGAMGDAQDGASFPRAGLPKTTPSPDASTVDASTATRVLRILLELTAPAGGGSLANFDVSTLRFDEAAKLIELAQAKLGVTSWAGNGRRAGGGVGAVVGAGRTLGSRGSLTPELLVQQVTELERILQMRRPPGVEPPKVAPPGSPRRRAEDAQDDARAAGDAKPPLETALPNSVWAEEGDEGSPHMDVPSAESGTLAPPPLQPPPDVPETGSEPQGSPAAPTTALGTAAAGSLAAPMKAFIDAFESEEGKAELRRLFHSIDTDGSGVVSSKEWGKAIGQHWKLMGRFFGGLTIGEVGQMFKKLDADGSGDLTWGEFETALQQMDWSVRLAQALESQQGAAELKALWDRLDKNGDGKVSGKEWGSAVHKNQQVMAKYFGGKDLKGIGKMFSKIDADGSGDLTWDEFVNGSIRLVQLPILESTELPNMASPSAGAADDEPPETAPSPSPSQAVLPPDPDASSSAILGDQPPTPRGEAARARAVELKLLADAKEAQHRQASDRAEMAEEAAAEAEAAMWRGGQLHASLCPAVAARCGGTLLDLAALCDLAAEIPTVEGAALLAMQAGGALLQFKHVLPVLLQAIKVREPPFVLNGYPRMVGHVTKMQQAIGGPLALVVLAGDLSDATDEGLNRNLEACGIHVHRAPTASEAEVSAVLEAMRAAGIAFRETPLPTGEAVPETAPVEPTGEAAPETAPVEPTAANASDVEPPETAPSPSPFQAVITLGPDDNYSVRMAPSPSPFQAVITLGPDDNYSLHKLHAAAGPLLLAVQAGDASRGADAKLGPWLASHGVPIHTLAGARDDLSAVVNAVASAIGRARDTSPFESAAAEAADRDLEAEAADRNLEAEAADRNLEAEAKTQTEAETQAKVAAEPETEAQAEVEAQPEVAAEPDLQANAAEELLADTLYEITFGKLEAEAEAQALALAEAEVEAQAEVEALAEKLLAAALFEATFGEVEAQAQAEAEAEAAPFHAVVTRLPDANYAVNITLRQRGDGGAHMLPIPA